MIATAFDEENSVLDPPPGMTVDDVHCLSVFRGKMENGIPVVVSCWKPDAEEWEEMRRTGRVWLMVMVETMPPVAMVGHNPWGGT